MGRYIRQNSIALAGQLARVAQSIVLIPLMVNSVGVAAYGTWVLLDTMLGFLFGISTLGVGYMRDRHLPSTHDPSGRRALVYPQLFFQVGMIGVMSIPVWVIAYVLPSGDADSFSPSLGILVLLANTAFSQTNSYFRHTVRILACTVQGTIQSLGQVIAIITLATTGHLGINELLVAQAVVYFLVALPGVWVIARELGGPLVKPTVVGIIKDMKVGFPLVVSFVVDVLLAFSDRFVLAAFLPRSFVGAYAAAYTLASIPLMFPRAAGMVVPQMLIQAVDTGRPGAARAMLRLTYRLNALVAIPFCFGAVSLGPDVLRLFAGEEVMLIATWVVPVVSVGVFLYGTTLLVSQVLFVQGRTRIMLLASAASAAGSLILNIILLALLPSVVVPAFVTVISYGLMFWLMTRRLNVNWVEEAAFGLIFRVIAASSIMAFVLAWTSQDIGIGLTPLLLHIAFGIAVYAGSLVILGTTRLFDWAELRGLIP